MPLVPADLRIEVRWIAPMTVRGSVFEHHSLLVRDGKILDVLPSSLAAQRYSATALLQRPTHIAVPGLVNANADAATALLRGVTAQKVEDARLQQPEFVRDSVLLSIAGMLKSGITCCVDRGYFPEQVARCAHEQGIRAAIGMPIAETGTRGSASAAEHVTRALRLRDEYKGHPLLSMIFAPDNPNLLHDETFARLVTLADELDAGIMVDVHRTRREVAECLERYGVRPLERLWKLGLLTPALNAVHMNDTTPADVELAQRTGISVTVCPLADLALEQRLPPAAALAAAGIRMGLGGSAMSGAARDIWGELKVLGLLTGGWDALTMATRGGATVLGLDADLGTLEAGKWADLCCIDMSGPATHPVHDVVTQLAAVGGRDLVSDVWVAGRQLVSDGELTRLDWPALVARTGG